MVFSFKKKTDKEKSHYLSAKESREIAKRNNRTIRELEKRKKRINRDFFLKLTLNSKEKIYQSK